MQICCLNNIISIVCICTRRPSSISNLLDNFDKVISNFNIKFNLCKHFIFNYLLLCPLRFSQNITFVQHAELLFINIIIIKRNSLEKSFFVYSTK